jgi:hypothetical protein
MSLQTYSDRFLLHEGIRDLTITTRYKSNVNSQHIDDEYEIPGWRRGEIYLIFIGIVGRHDFNFKKKVWTLESDCLTWIWVAYLLF